ncbi:hypothetical protein BDW62DRAFT_208012 [Aspergillus aurantiobrunneus]
MTDDGDIQQRILQRTLQEVAQEQQQEDASEPCVICLEPITEPAVAVSCNHASFDFLCLVSWLEQRHNCPLCKSDISSVKYDLERPDGPKFYQLPDLPPLSTDAASTGHIHPHGRRPNRNPRRPRGPRSPSPQQTPNDPLLRRQEVYRNRLYSLRVGSNRLSQYREFTPEMVNRDEELVSRARKWIRRELRVFEFLHPGTPSDSSYPVGRPRQQRLESRRGNNAEFLLEYIIAILRTVDIKGSAGQAEELLKDFLGRDNASLFLHELQAWLRSPYVSLEDWDRNVQYEDTDTAAQRARQGPATSRTTTPVHGGRVFRGRIGKPRYPRGQPRQDRTSDSRTQRVQYARDRYIPD